MSKQGWIQTIRSRPGKAESFLENLLETVAGKELLTLRKGETLFVQGEDATAIYFIQTGEIQLTVVSVQGRNVLLTMMGPGDFFGEECLVEDSRRTSTATSIEETTVFRIEKGAMRQALQVQPRLCEGFIDSLLTRNVSLETSLRVELFKS